MSLLGSAGSFKFCQIVDDREWVLSVKQLVVCLDADLLSHLRHTQHHIAPPFRLINEVVQPVVIGLLLPFIHWF